MKCIVLSFLMLLPFLSKAQSQVDTTHYQSNEQYSMIVVNVYYGFVTKGSIAIYYPDLAAPIQIKTNEKENFEARLLKELNKHAQEGWTVLDVHVKNLELWNPTGTETRLMKDETTYLFKRVKK